MAHPRRAAAARALQKSLPGAPVVFDPEPHGRPSALRTAAAAWRAVPADATHHLVVQDDAMVAEDLPARALELAAAHPASAIALFAQWNTRNGAAVRLGAASGVAAVPGVVGDYVPCVALMLPKAVALGFASHCQGFGEAMVEDDLAITGYLLHRGVDIRLSVPSLVEHLDGASLVGNGSHGLRRAACFLRSPGPIRSASEPPPSAIVPYFRSGKAYALVRSERPAEPWAKVPLRDAPLGFELPLDGEVDERLGPLPDELWSLAGPEALRELWLCAYAQGRTAPAGAGAGEAAVSLALHTLGVAGVRERVTHDLLAAVGRRLDGFALDGFAAGRSATSTDRD